jgi:hypothetical protein
MGSGSTYQDVPTIAAAKGLPEGTLVSLTGKVLYMKKSGYGYIEESNRTDGIRLQGTISADENKLVTVKGTMGPASGERYIVVESVTGDVSASVGSLGANNKYLADTKLNGLYVKAWGVVKAGSVIGNTYFITDGYKNSGIKVITQGVPVVTEGSLVVVSGAAGTDAGVRVIYAK